MKVKDVLRDLGSEVKVQIFRFYPQLMKYHKLFINPYNVATLREKKDEIWIRKYLNDEIDHVEYSTIASGREFETHCDIYLKAKEVVREEKPSAIDYADLKKKWERFRKEYCLEGADPVRAGHISLFLTKLSNGELIEMEDKDLS